MFTESERNINKIHSTLLKETTFILKYLKGKKLFLPLFHEVNRIYVGSPYVTQLTLNCTFTVHGNGMHSQRTFPATDRV